MSTFDTYTSDEETLFILGQNSEEEMENYLSYAAELRPLPSGFAFYTNLNDDVQIDMEKIIAFLRKYPKNLQLAIWTGKKKR